MFTVVKPEAEIRNIIPSETFIDDNGNKQHITPDENIFAESTITFKNTEHLRILLDQRKEDPENFKKSVNKLINSAGAGHASLTTSVALDARFGEDTSKFVDSMFTGAPFGSFLMPSSRRVPIAVENLVVPEGLHKGDQGALNEYMRVSEANVAAYNILIEDMHVQKQNAAKIVQYGHKGGGKGTFNLEVLVSLAHEIRNNEDLFPSEGLKIIETLENQIVEKGAGLTYFSRYFAPRAALPHPNIFHGRTNYATHLIDKDPTLLDKPTILNVKNNLSSTADKKIRDWLKRRDEVFSGDYTYEQAMEILSEITTISGDHRLELGVDIGANTAWRVWGEIKRHRTMPATTEPVYHALDRANEAVRIYEKTKNIKDLSRVCTFPGDVLNNKNAERLWAERFVDSVKTYHKLVAAGSDKKDLIYMIPRTLKLYTVRSMDAYNLLSGYTPLRACNTCEQEMKATTLNEIRLIKNEFEGNAITEAILSKCGYVGVCADRRGKIPCGVINNVSPGYDAKHEALITERNSMIEKAYNPKGEK